MRVPTDMVEHEGGKNNIVRSLNTTDPREAKVQRDLKLAHCQRRWMDLRNEPAPVGTKEGIVHHLEALLDQVRRGEIDQHNPEYADMLAGLLIDGHQAENTFVPENTVTQIRDLRGAINDPSDLTLVEAIRQ